MPAHGPAYRIVTERLVLRCWDPRDAEQLKLAIDASRDQLVPWLTWARDEPLSLDARIESLRRTRAKFDLDKDYAYGIFDREERVVLGGCGLHERGHAEARELGYWVWTAHVGAGFASEASAALVRVAFELERLARVEIHCDEDNTRSASIPRRLGFRHDATLRGQSLRADGTGAGRMVWTMFAAEYEGSPASRAAIEAFDAGGRQILEPPPPPATRRRSLLR